MPGSLLKLWMRELIYPIVPVDLYDQAIESAANDDPQLAVSIVKKMPKINQKVFTCNFFLNFIEYYCFFFFLSFSPSLCLVFFICDCITFAY